MLSAQPAELKKLLNYHIFRTNLARKSFFINILTVCTSYKMLLLLFFTHLCTTRGGVDTCS